MLAALDDGHGSQAQFDHPEFGGAGQWMRGGMTMLSAMFDQALRQRVDALCSMLSERLRADSGLVRASGFQSQHQGDGASSGSADAGAARVGDAAEAADDSGDSLFAAVAGRGWWPSSLPAPDSVGSQDGTRYGYVAQAHRLAIDLDGAVTVYDTRAHRITGFSQQQGTRSHLAFDGPDGTIPVERLPVVSSTAGRTARGAGDGRAPASVAGPPALTPTAAGAPDVFTMLERLAGLRDKGILDDAEFRAKKAQLLKRL